MLDECGVVDDVVVPWPLGHLGSVAVLVSGARPRLCWQVRVSAFHIRHSQAYPMPPPPPTLP